MITETLYHPDWLSNPPEGAYVPQQATVELIGAEEYAEIIEQLDGGETIPIPEPEPEPELPSDPEPEPEDKPMTIQEMRNRIAEMDDVLSIILGVVE